MARKQLSLASNEIGMAVMEHLEEGVEEIIAHHKDPRVGEKSSTITIKITLKPNGPRDRFGSAVVRDVNLAKRDSESWEGRIFVRYDEDGQVDYVSDQDPRQVRMDFSER